VRQYQLLSDAAPDETPAPDGARRAAEAGRSPAVSVATAKLRATAAAPAPAPAGRQETWKSNVGGQIPVDCVLNSIRLFAQEVAPRLRAGS